MNSCASAPSRLSATVAISCALVFTQVAAQPVPLAESDVQLVQSQQLLDQLTTTFGRLDPRLLESLTQLSNQLSERQEYLDANDILERAIQITRISEGLYTRGQLPFQFSKINNLINAGDWRRANRMMAQMLSLLNRGDSQVDEEFVQASLQLADFHLKGVVGDRTVRQSTHIKLAARITERTANLAARAWGRNDLRLPAILYKRVVQLHLQVRAVEAGGSVGIGLRSFSSSGLARPRQEVLLEYYFAGLARLSQIRNIYMSQQTPNPQAIALTDVYIGDWQVLFANQEEAETAYLRSYSGFRNADIKQQEINRFFQTPTLLPAISFYSDWEEANAALNIAAGEGLNDGDVANLTVLPWSINFTHVSSPIEYDTLNAGPVSLQGMAEYSITLMGLEKVYRWYKGRHITSISTANELKKVRGQISDPEAQYELEARIKSIRFRPRLVDGVAQAVSAKLFYDTFQ